MMTETRNGQALMMRPQALAPVIEWNQAQIDLLKRTLAASKTTLANDELALFIAVCKRTQLDPFLRQIWAIKDKSGRLIIHVGIDGRRATAQRTGLVAGSDGPYWCGDDEVWHDVWLSADAPAAAKYTVFKNGSARGYTAVVTLKSFAGRSPNWQDMPDHMLAKCAEDHAHRKAFPYEMGGLPTYNPELDRDAAEDDAAEDWERLQAQNPAPAPARAAQTRHASPPAPPQAPHIDAESRELPDEEPPAGTRTSNAGAEFAREYADVLDQAGMQVATEHADILITAGTPPPGHEESPLRAECRALHKRMIAYPTFAAVLLPADDALDPEWNSFLDGWGGRLKEHERAMERRGQTAQKAQR